MVFRSVKKSAYRYTTGGFYSGITSVYNNRREPDKWRVPARSTLQKPEVIDNKIAKIKNPTDPDSGWDYVPNFVGYTGFNKVTGAQETITQYDITPAQAGLVDDKPVKPVDVEDMRQELLQKIKRVYDENKDISILLTWTYNGEVYRADTFSAKNIDSAQLLINNGRFEELYLWAEDGTLIMVSISSEKVKTEIERLQAGRRRLLRDNLTNISKIKKGDIDALTNFNTRNIFLENPIFSISLDDAAWETKLIEEVN